MEVRIYYEDTDCGGVVYYGGIISKYFERARTQYLEERGLSVSRAHERRHGVCRGTRRSGLPISSPLWRPALIIRDGASPT